jgi:hypothetical protein
MGAKGMGEVEEVEVETRHGITYAFCPGVFER